MSDAANVLQWIFVLNSVQHKFFHVSIVKNLHILLEKSAEGLGSRGDCCWGYVCMRIDPKSYHIFPVKVIITLLSGSCTGTVRA